MEALGINISGLLTQIISFSILVGILYSFLYKPILKMLDNRSNKIKESLSKATEVQAQSEETETAIQAKLAEANKASQDILSKARETASKLHDSELNKLCNILNPSNETRIFYFGDSCNLSCNRRNNR